MAVIEAFAQPASICPICHHRTNKAHRPFCSRRCGDVDLANWFGGAYVVYKNDSWDVVDSDETNCGIG